MTASNNRDALYAVALGATDGVNAATFMAAYNFLRGREGFAGLIRGNAVRGNRGIGILASFVGPDLEER